MVGSRILLLISVVVYSVALLLFIIGFGTPNWVELNQASSGLWKGCSPNACYEIRLANAPDYHQATAAFMIIGFLAALAGGALYIISPLSALMQLIAGASTIIAVCIYGDKIRRDMDVDVLGFSFALATVAGLVFIANAIFVGIVAFRRGKKFNLDLFCKA